MKTYTCDRCGFEAHDTKGIVGREFERMGFQTLTPAFRWPDVVDVCGPCFTKLEREWSRVRGEADAAQRARFMAAAQGED